MKIIKYFLLNTLLCALCLPLSAQPEVIDGKRWHEELYSNRIANDGENLWLATSKGLIKYNKSNGKAYNAALELYYTTEDSRFTAIDTYNYDGDIVICYSIDNVGPKTFDGAKIDDYSTIFYYCYAYSFARCPQGGIWATVGTIVVPPVDSVDHARGISVSPNSISSRIPMANLDIKFDSNGNLWLATYGEYEYLLCYMPNKFSKKCSLSGRKKITSIAIDKNDNIWYASEDGINCYYQATGQEVCMTKEQYPAMLENRYFGNDIDDRGSIWFTSENNLLRWDGSEFITYTCDGYEEARAMLCDGNIVWVLLKNDMLLKFQNNRFETIDLTPAVTGIKESTTDEGNTKAYVSNGMLYIESADGINSVEVYDAMGRTILTPNPSAVERGTTNAQISLPSTLKGVIMVKVNNEVVKVIIN